MEQNVSWEADSSSDSQEITWILWKAKGSLSYLQDILDKINSVHAIVSYLCNIDFNITFQSTARSPK